MKNSFLSDLNHIEKNHEEFINNNKVVLSSKVKRILSSRNLSKVINPHIAPIGQAY